MKKNKIFKIMLTVLMLIVMVGTSGKVFARPVAQELDDGGSQGEKESSSTGSEGYVEVTPENPGDVANGISNLAGQILFVAQMIGMAVATIMLIVLGIKYITASPDGKAEIKKSAWIYVVGALGIFGASFIVGLLKNMFTNL